MTAGMLLTRGDRLSFAVEGPFVRDAGTGGALLMSRPDGTSRLS